MTIEAAFYSTLSAHAGLIAKVSTRIYPLVLPQDCRLPAVCIRRVSDIPEYLLDLAVALQETRMQVSSFAETLAEALAIGAQVKLALVGLSGSHGGVTIGDIRIENENDLYEPDTDIYHIPIDFMVYYSE